MFHVMPDVDLWDKGRWLAEFHEADCIVLTAQIFLNLLKHAYWSLENVSPIPLRGLKVCSLSEQFYLNSRLPCLCS